MNKKRLSVFIIALFIMSLPAIVNAQFANEVKLLASDGAADDWFGYSVSISGDTAIVGAFGDDDNGILTGAAYVSVRDPATGVWIDQQELLASDGALGDNFGWSVSISGDTAIVGATGDDDNGGESGSAYVFVRDPATGIWTEQPKLLASDGALGDNFGYSVSIDGDTAIVGAYGDDDNGNASGSAYIFVRDPVTGVWIEQQELLASDAAADDWFGWSVSVNGDTAIAGATRDDDNGTRSGSVYVFVRDLVTGVWTEQQKLLASDGAAYDLFGGSVSISGDTMIAGALGNDVNGSESGSAYIFVRSGATWTEQQKLLASDAAAGDNFGSSVSLSGDTAIVGAVDSDDNVAESGSAYVFVRDPATGVWTEQQELLASDGAAYDKFGYSVSISGDTAIVGAHGNDDNGVDSGSAYVYGPIPEISVTDSVAPNNDLQMPFGDVTVGTSSTIETATISNAGNAALNVSGIQLTGADALEYTLNLTGGTSPCGSAAPTVPAGTNCTVTITFNPATTGAKTANIEITSDDADEDTVNVALSGTGIAATAPEIDVTDSIGVDNDLQMPFGDVTVGTSSTVETATISNAGNAALNVSGIQLTGADAGEYSLDINGGASPCGATAPAIAPSGNCTVTITFNPATTGAKTANLEITSDDSDEVTVNVILSGTGTAAPAPEIDVADTLAPNGDLLMPFGNITEGLSSIAETVTISNVGTASLNVSSIQLTGADTGEYTLDINGGANSCGSTTLIIAQGDNCTVTVTFSPTSTGLKTANLEITSDDSDEGTVNVALSGTGFQSVTNNPPDKPQLVYPSNGQQSLPITVTLEWEPVTDPDGDTVSYDVYHCTSADPANNCAPAAVALQQKVSDNSTYFAGLSFGGGVLIFGITLAGGIRSRKRIALLIAVIAVTCALVASCGSGNNNGHTPDDNNKTYTVSGLNSNTTYYWTVIAKDSNGGETQSDVWSFKTQ